MIYVVLFYHERAGSSRVLKYTNIDKIPNCEIMLFWQNLGIFFKTAQQYWYWTSIDSDYLAFGHKIFEIKSLGIIEDFWVNMFLKGYPLEAKTAPQKWN